MYLMLLLRCVPRIRGDGPENTMKTRKHHRHSPYTRGWAGGNDLGKIGPHVFSVNAGMSRLRFMRSLSLPGLLRECGDEPLSPIRLEHQRLSSPWMRGWADPYTFVIGTNLVFSVNAGMSRSDSSS